MFRIDLIIPAYNEELRIRATLEDYLMHFGKELRLVVVINNTTDGTRAVVEEVAAANPGRVQILEEKGRIGKGGAILLGWRHADAELVGFVDADGATGALEFKKLVAAMEDAGVDGAIANRFLPGAKIIDRESALRSTASRTFIWLVRRMFKLPFTDFQCGAKLFRGKVIKDILPVVRTTDMTFDVDLLWRVQQRGYKIREVPTVWFDKPGSALLDKPSNFLKTSWRMFRSLVGLRFIKAKTREKITKVQEKTGNQVNSAKNP